MTSPDPVFGQQTEAEQRFMFSEYPQAEPQTQPRFGGGSTIAAPASPTVPEPMFGPQKSSMLGETTEKSMRGPTLVDRVKGISRFKERAVSSLGPEDRDFLIAKPFSSWAKDIGVAAATASTNTAKAMNSMFKRVPNSTPALFDTIGRMLPSAPSLDKAIDFVAASAGVKPREVQDLKKQKPTILQSMYEGIVVPMKETAQIAALPDGEEKQRAYDAQSYKIAQAFVSSLTVGVADDAMRNNSIWLDGGDLYWQGKKIDELSEMEAKGVRSGNLWGQIGGSMVTYAMVSPMLSESLRSVPALKVAFEKHPVIAAAFLTNAAEEGFEAVVRKGTNQEYGFNDTVIGLFSGAVFEMGKAGIGKMTEADVGVVRDLMNEKTAEFVRSNGHYPDPSEMRLLLGDVEIPKLGMTFEEMHKSLAGSSFKESRLIQYSGGREGRPGIDYSERQFPKTLQESGYASPEVKRGVEQSLEARFYKPITNADTLQQAKVDIDADKARVINEFMNPGRKNTAQDVFRGAELVRRFSQEGRVEDAVDVAEVMARQSTTTAQALQAHSAIANLDENGVLVFAARRLQEYQDQRSGRGQRIENEIRTVTDELKGVNDEVIDQVIDSLPVKQEPQPEARGPQSPEGRLAKRIVSHVSDPASRTPDPITDMVNMLFAVAKEELPKRKVNPPRDPIEFLAQAIENRKEYGDIWDAARAKVLEVAEAEGRPVDLKALDEFVDRPLKSPLARKKLSQAISKEMKSQGVNLEKLVREHYSKIHATGDELRQALVDKAGLTDEAASQLSLEVQKQFYALTEQKKAAIIAKSMSEKKAAVRKTEIQRLVELSNVGAFENKAFRDFFAKKYGVETLTPDKAKKLQEMAKVMQELPDGEAKNVQALMIRQAIEDMTPSTLLEKLSSAQTIGMLGNIVTGVRNLIGSGSQAPAEAGRRLFATPVDVAISRFTGKRTTTAPALLRGYTPELHKFFVDAYKGIREAYQGINTRSGAARYMSNVQGQRRMRVFRRFDPETQGMTRRIGRRIESGFRFTEDSVYAMLASTDRPFYEMGFRSSIENQMAARGLDYKAAEADGFKNIPEDIRENAQLDGQYMVFEEPSRLADGSRMFKRALNLGLDFGLGDAVWKFAGIPAVLVKHALEYSPVGYGKFVLEVAKGMTGRDWSQKAAVDAFGRATMGTAGMIGVGYKLADLGIIQGNPDEDRKIESLKRQLGIGKHTINMSAFKRYALSWDEKQAKPKDGDMIIQYDWMQPFAINVAIGASLNSALKQRSLKDGSLTVAESAFASLAEGLESVEGMSLMQGLNAFMYGDDSMVQRALVSLKSMPASFVPTFFNQIRKFTDNTRRITYDEDWKKEVTNTVINRLPWMSKSLPSAKSPLTGETLRYMEPNDHDVYNIFFSPATVQRFHEDKILKEMLAVATATDDSSFIPRAAKKTININGEEKRLTNAEYKKYQDFVYPWARYFAEQAMASEQYWQMDDETRAAELAGFLRQVNSAAKIALFGQQQDNKPRLPTTNKSGLDKAIVQSFLQDK